MTESEWYMSIKASVISADRTSEVGKEELTKEISIGRNVIDLNILRSTR